MNSEKFLRTPPDDCFCIGKSKNLGSFKIVKHLSCQYVAQKKSWMDSQIFEHGVLKLDRKFRVDERKIDVIIDSSPVHPPIFNLTNIQFVFLHPNTASILQPIDQGVIRSPKLHYRGKVVRLLFRALEKNEPYPKI